MSVVCLMIVGMFALPLADISTVSQNGITYEIEPILDKVYYIAKRGTGDVSYCSPCSGDTYLADICPGDTNKTSTCIPCAPGYHQPVEGYHIRTYCVKEGASEDTDSSVESFVEDGVSMVALQGIPYDLKSLPWTDSYLVKVNGALRHCQTCQTGTFLFGICEEEGGESVCMPCPLGTHQPAMSHLNTSCEEMPERETTVTPSVTPVYQAVALNLTCAECPNGLWKKYCTKDRDNNTVALCCHNVKDNGNFQCKIIESPQGQEFDSSANYSVNVTTTAEPSALSKNTSTPNDEDNRTREEEHGSETTTPRTVIIVVCVLGVIVLTPVIVRLVIALYPRRYYDPLPNQ